MLVVSLALATVCLAGTSGVVKLRVGDLLVNGDGCGTAPEGSGVNPRSGQIVNAGVFGGSATPGAVFHTTNGTLGKADLTYVDGVFTIDGSSRVDSQATTFAFPDTAGTHWDALRNGISLVESGGLEVPLILADQPAVERPGVGMHSNAGFTIDLAAVRAAWPTATVARVSGVAGMTTDVFGGGDVDFFVLVDAVQKWTGTAAAGAALPFSVDLASSDFYLTLACSDFDVSNGSDHGAIADLVIELEGIADCNLNETPDSCDIQHGESVDCNLNGMPDECEGGFSTYGQGCPGSGGHIPKLEASGCAIDGGQIVVSISGAIGGATALLFFGINEANTPMGLGCSLLVQPLFPVFVELPMGGTGFGNGSVNLGSVIPPNPPAQFTFQAFIADFGGPLGFSNTNAILVVIV